MALRFFPMLCSLAILLQLGVALASSSEWKPRSKRSSKVTLSKHSLNDLVLELAKTQLMKMITAQSVEMAKIQHSLQKLQRELQQALINKQVPESLAAKKLM